MAGGAGNGNRAPRDALLSPDRPRTSAPSPRTAKAAQERSAGGSTPGSGVRGARLVLIGELHKLDYMYDPSTGLAQYIAKNLSEEEDMEVHIAALQFVEFIVSIPTSPFQKLPGFVDAYLPFHYFTFLRLYNSASIMSDTIALCKLHLAILLALATGKTRGVAQKFFKLRVLHFWCPRCQSSTRRRSARSASTTRTRCSARACSRTPCLWRTRAAGVSSCAPSRPRR